MKGSQLHVCDLLNHFSWILLSVAVPFIVFCHVLCYSLSPHSRNSVQCEWLASFPGSLYPCPDEKIRVRGESWNEASE